MLQKVLPFGILVLLACSGCSPKIEIEGEAFVEKSGVATKLANVEIQIVPEEQFAKFIKSKVAAIDGEIVSINARIKQREDSIDVMTKSNQTVMDAQMKLFDIQLKVASIGVLNIDTLGGQYRTQQLESAHAKAGESMKKSSDAIDDSKREVEKLKQSIEGLKTGKNASFYYSDKIPESIAKVSTSADGKFKIAVPSEKRAALVAAKGDTYWFLWVSPKGAKNLNLTNSNSTDTNCDTCIFDGKTIPQSL